MMSAAVNRIAAETYDLLECRLHRIEHLLGKDLEQDDAIVSGTLQDKETKVHIRLARIEFRLSQLSFKHAVVHELLQLHTTYPDLFQPPALGEVPTTLKTSELLAVVNSCATSYHTTAARLNSFKDLPVPSAENSASLITLHPRLAKAEIIQGSQAQQVAYLRQKTASLIQRWYETGVLNGGECWVEWEDRITEIEKQVRRKETLQAQDTRAKHVYDS